MDRLPKVLQRKIMLHMDIRDILNFNQINRRYYNIARDNNFWHDKVKMDFPEQREPISDDIAWKFVSKLYQTRRECLNKFVFDVNEFNKFGGNWQYGRTICEHNLGGCIYARLLSIQRSNSGQIKMQPTDIFKDNFKQIEMYGTYTSENQVYPIKICNHNGDIKVCGDLKFFEAGSGKVSAQCVDDLKRIIYVTDPTFFEAWSELDEIFNSRFVTYASTFSRPQILTAGMCIHPYWYFLPKLTLSYSTYYMLFSNNCNNSYIEAMFKQHPELTLFDQQQLELANITINKFDAFLRRYTNYDLFKPIIGSISLGMFMGTPFLIYTMGDNNVYVRVATTNTKQFLLELRRIICDYFRIHG